MQDLCVRVSTYINPRLPKLIHAALPFPLAPHSRSQIAAECQVRWRKRRTGQERHGGGVNAMPWFNPGFINPKRFLIRRAPYHTITIFGEYPLY